jgi:ABC-2 type transport system permease protein
MHLNGVVPALRPVWFEIRRAIRGRWFVVLGICAPLLVYTGYAIGGIGGATDRSIGGISWPSYFMVSMAAFGAMSAAVGIAARPVRGMRGSARIVSALVLALPPLVVLGLAGAIDGVHLPDAEWAAFIGLLWLGSLPFVALGLLLGPVLDADSREIAVLSVLTVLAILGGLFQPVASLPAGLAALAHVLPSYHLADLGWTLIAARGVDPVDVLVLAGYTVAIGVVVVWRMRNEDPWVGDRGDTDGGTAARRRA